MAKLESKFKLTDLNMDVEDFKEFIHAFKKGVPFRKLMPYINDDHIESLYCLASRLYDDGKYEDATKIFVILVFLDYNDPRFSMGLGACNQNLKKYFEATINYSAAALIALEDPRPACYCADCHLLLGDVETAIIFYKRASYTTEDDLDKKEVRQKAKKMHQLLIKEHNYKK